MDQLLHLMGFLGTDLHNEVSIRELSKQAKVPYTTTYRLVKNNPNLFSINQKGNMKLCSLNTNDSITKHYLILAEREKAELFQKKYPLLKILKKDLLEGDYSLVLFGSRAEEKHRKNSDMDLCIINKDGRKNHSFSKFELLFKVEVNPMYLTKNEFKQMLKDKEHNVGKEIVKKHVVLYGEELFWNLIWKNGI